MKILFLSDSQYYKNPNRSIIRENGLSSWFIKQLEITDYIFNLAEEKKVDLIIHGGDVFEEKNRIDQIVYNKVWEKYRSCSKDVIINAGNHDLINIQRDSSLYTFSTFACTTIEVTTYTYRDLILRVIPFGQVTAASLRVPDIDKPKILITHEFIEGLTWKNKSSYKPNIIRKDLLTSWDFIFNGHVHTPQEIDNIINIGSIMPQDFNEAGESKRCVIYDSMTNKVEFFKLPAPKFILLDSIPNGGVDETNYYRININTKDLTNSIFNSYNVIPYITKSEKRELRLPISNIDPDEDIKGYVALKNDGLEVDKLLIIGKELYGGEV